MPLDIASSQADAPEVAAGPVSSIGLIDALETDILRVIASVAQSAHAARTLASETRVEIETIRGGMAVLADNGRGVTSDVISLAAAAEQLTMTSNEISAAMVNANGEIRDAAQAAHHATGLIAELSQATREISGVVSTIADVARQTNLLALNATIEAARAGASGRGFAVVAGEVKSLAVETSEATGNIGRRIERLNQSAGASIQAIERIVEIIGRIQPRFTMVETSVGQQISAIAELAQRTAETSSFIAAVSDKVATMDAAASNAAGSVAEANEVTGRASDLAGDLGRRFTMVVREADLGNRRSHRRYPVALPVALSGGGPELRLTSLDLSLGGMRIAAKPDELIKVDALPTADIAGLGRIALRIVARGKATAHAAFIDPRPEFMLALKELLAERETHYAGLVAMMNERAAKITGGLEAAVQAGEITEQALFEPAYKPIPGTNPEQFETAALSVLERVLRPIQEPVLEHDPRIAFCCAVDLNGYLPVHHAKYSQPQRPGEIAWNIANSRNRRIFTDTFGIFAVRAMRPFVMQTYAREMGDKTVMMASVDVPLRIFGRPWGGLRMGYQL